MVYGKVKMKSKFVMTTVINSGSKAASWDGPKTAEIISGCWEQSSKKIYDGMPCMYTTLIWVLC